MSIDKVGGHPNSRFERLLTKADANKDSKLSREELSSIKREDGSVKFSEARLDKLFSRFDKDKDGLLSANEFQARGQDRCKGHKHQGPHAFENQARPSETPNTTPPTPPQSFFERLLAKLDLNGDGNITADEIKAFKDKYSIQKAAADKTTHAEPAVAVIALVTDNVNASA